MTQGNAQNIRWVYNFVFPHGCREFAVYGYIFKRVPEYVERVQSLQHIISSFSEFDMPRKTGIHAITATVNLPRKEKKPVILWGDQNAAALNDILLLFSIFTRRDIFMVPKPVQEGDEVIVADPREYFFGLPTTIEYEEGGGEHGERCDAGFQKGVEAVYGRMRTAEWQKEYGKGRFLLLFRSACKRQILETSFITCWTIWEILFALHNQSRLSDEQIVKLPVSEKIAFILTRYEIKKSLDGTDRKGIKHFAKIRHALVHAGRFLDNAAFHDATLFVHVTAIIVAKILGLTGSDVLGSQGKLLARLQGQEVVPTWEELKVLTKRS